MKPHLIIISGPTAVGKTELSIHLAKELNGEIISADSMQIYKYMDIGSAKISAKEMKGVKHYLIDTLRPDEEFNVLKFQQMAKEAMKNIYETGKIPIITGGTGFYIQSVLYDISFSNQDDRAIRKELLTFMEQNGKEALYRELQQVDPSYARNLHPNNVKKVIRGLAFYKSTGKPLSLHNQEEQKKESPYNFCYFVLTMERNKLYNRIDKRVDQMMESGLLEEVSKLKKMGYDKNMVSMQGLGYKELFSYLEGEISLLAAVEKIKRDTRHFAKRQMTWFRREKDVIFIEKNHESLHNMLVKVKEIINDDEK